MRSYQNHLKQSTLCYEFIYEVVGKREHDRDALTWRANLINATDNRIAFL